MSQIVQRSSVAPLRETLRRARIIEFINFCFVLSRSQLQQRLFSSTDYGAWKCRTELKRLTDAKMIRRGRCMVTNDFVYWTDKKPENINHLIQVNWCWLTLELSGELGVFKHEYPCGDILQADAYFEFNGKPYFLEMHRMVNKKNFDEKIQKYEQYFHSEKWDVEGWPVPGKFAKILVVTESEHDKKKIQAKTEKSELNFIVDTLEAFKSDYKIVLGINTPKEEKQAENKPVERSGWEAIK